ncbi:hypothetical protein NE865_03144 [Phthorimaea operculella]|nr:hypothetical protein NE865_03144 [Phthorimaea operculella]
MFLYPLLVMASTEPSESAGPKCGDFDANFNLRKVIGAWNVVAIIPEKMFPVHQEQVTCYKVEFSETDVAGLRWLVNRTFEKPPRKDLIERIKGTIVRQRYHSVPPFDVWSKSVEGVNGCFQQVLSLDTDKSDINKVLTHEALMQLHIQETADGPFLVQMLWGKMISAVIYRRKQGVTPEQLKPITEFVTKLRGPQMKPKICDRSLKDLLGLRH